MASLITLVLITLPRLPLAADDDSSWGAVLGYAHQQGLQFGTDLAFTYGPFGFLVTPYFCPHAPALRLFTDFALCSTVVAGVCLLAWRLTGWWRWVLLAVFTFMSGNADPRSELLIDIGLLCWGMLCLLESGSRLWLSVSGLMVLAVFAALAKLTFLFAATVTVAIIALDLLLRDRTQPGLILLLGFLLGVPLAWMVGGQKLFHLGSFLANAWSISSDYDQAMGFEAFPLLTRTALLMALSVMAVVIIRAFTAKDRGGKIPRWRGGLQFAWFTALIFVVWKHGFVRVGRDHAEIFLAFIPTLAVALEAWRLNSRVALLWARASAALCCLLGLFALQWLFSGDVRSCLTRPLNLLASHVQTVLKPSDYWKNLKELQGIEVAALQLPRLREKIGSASVDVFGCNQSYGVFNNLNYRPRPVFQSYAAYSEPLMRLNEDFYSSSRAPEYVLFRLNAIDDRFPPLEDALLFRTLLLDYEPVDGEGPFLLLKARQHTAAQVQFLREGTIKPGELLDLREWLDSDIWLALDLQPTFLGRVRAFFFQAPAVNLGVWCRGNINLKMAQFRAPAPMLAAGFVANPLLLENEDVLALYTGSSVARAVAYSIELPAGTQPFWQDAVGFKLYKIQDRIERRAAPDLMRLLTYPGFQSAPVKVMASLTNSILQVGGKPALVLVGGGYLQFDVPPQTKAVRGSFGFAAAAYLLGGATHGAEFRIEGEKPDGSFELLYTRTLTPLTNPDDRGLKTFSIPCPGESWRRCFLRAIPLSSANPAGELTCWSEIGFE